MRTLYLINESMSKTNETVCTIWHHFYNFKNVKNTHGEVLLVVKFQAKACFELKVWFYNNSKYKFYYNFLINELSFHTCVAAV